jgi:transposase InsO family protein
MDERVQFISDYQRQLFSMSELCQRYGVSRKTGYKWIARYVADGAAGLAERSSRPRHSPQATAASVARAIVALRQRYPTWGGKKILAVLREREPTWAWPAVSTASDLLKRAGLVTARHRRRPVGHRRYQATPVTAPNQVWTADFKGQFRTRDAQLCYPLTICDAYSRYLLRCDGLPAPTTAATMAMFWRAFLEFGLPERIRTDNGEPFAAASLGRLSRVSVWWIRLGIYPELIAPASPQQNGAHERMHRTLKAETTRPPAANRRGQQQRFGAFRRCYNADRPHEALNQQPPARLYVASPRSVPAVLEPLVYPGHWDIRRVHQPGVMSWHSRNITISTVLIGEDIGLEPIDDGEWDLHFGPIRLGRFDERTRRIEPAGRHRSC